MKEPNRALPYRADVDGLRAVAVLLVVFYHFGFWQVPGGFVGVDVFFVISGFLITGLIHREMEESRFTIRNFYERRIRRIFPALFVLLAAATAAAAVLLFPTDFESYAHTLIATAFFGANFEFWHEAGYFDLASAQKPLLHLWSIAVEEQFYLLFPALLLAIGSKSRGRLIWVVGALFVCSFAYSAWAVAHAPVSAFYLLPSRTWELMLGALLALGAVPAIRSQMARETVALLGLAMIGISGVFYQPWQPFPGIAALLPCLGTALVIHAGSAPTLINRALNAKPVVFVGLISYSLYLWHWPVLVFGSNVLGHRPDAMQTWALIALSFALAVISWRFVERPFRHGFKIAWRPLFAGAAGAMSITALCGFTIAADKGVPDRWQPEIRRILAEERKHEPRMDICFGLTARDVKDGRLCRIGSADAEAVSFLLWGDSHADALLPAVNKVARQRGRAGLFAGSGSCAPLLGVTRSDAKPCKRFNDAVAKLALRKDIQEVILDARWAKNANDPWGGPGRIALHDDEAPNNAQPPMEVAFTRGLERTVRLMVQAGKRVVIVAPVPEANYSVPRTLARLRMAGDHRDLSRTLDDYLAREKFVLATIEQMRARYGITIVYPHRVLCAGGTCEFADNDRPLYRDEHHLSVFGALKLVPLFEQAF